MQKEAFWLKTPCITLRKNTEWTETIQLGVNYLTETNTQKILETTDNILEYEERLRSKLEKLPNPFGEGNASQKIVNAIRNFWSKAN